MNRKWIYTTILLLILLIAVPSTYKVFHTHNERMRMNTIKKIEEAAEDCYYNDSCIEEKITLAEIYEKTGLQTMSNPITKKVYNEASYVDVQNNFKFIEVEG